MGIPFKAIFDVGEKLFSAARERKRTADAARFEHGKQQFLMAFVTKARTANVCRLGLRPMPGTQEFGYCESLVRDGLLDREIITERYFLKSSWRGYDGEGHRPC